MWADGRDCRSRRDGGDCRSRMPVDPRVPFPRNDGRSRVPIPPDAGGFPRRSPVLSPWRAARRGKAEAAQGQGRSQGPPVPRSAGRGRSPRPPPEALGPGRGDDREGGRHGRPRALGLQPRGSRSVLRLPPSLSLGRRSPVRAQPVFPRWPRCGTLTPAVMGT